MNIKMIPNSIPNTPKRDYSEVYMVRQKTQGAKITLKENDNCRHDST
jgi:hypothetical protein